MVSPIDRLRYQAARSIRRGSGTVLLTPNPGPRFGNFLYYWLHAHQHQLAGRAFRVQVHDHLEPWLQHFPSLRRELSVMATNIGFFDRREWPPASQFQGYGNDFDLRGIQTFVDRHLLSALESAVEPVVGAPLIVNVRRGDFYSEPKFRELYAFDVPSYVEVALRRARSIGPIPVVRVVSDDLAWCRDNLDEIVRAAGATEVHYGSRQPGALGDFTEIAAASRLIGANSTFSYWGAYVATVQSGGRAHIQMPGFVSRHPINARGVTPLLPQWDVVESIDGGWGVPGA